MSDMPITIAECRERRKPFPFKTSKGLNFMLRPVSLFSLIAAGGLPANLINVATAIATKTFRKKDYEENPAAFALLIEQLVVHGCAEPKLTMGEGTKDALSVSELEDGLKLELFTEISMHTNKIETEGGAEIDLKPFPADAGGAPAGADGKELEQDTV